MKVEIVKVETIKPSTPTHLKTHIFSHFDQLAISSYPSLVFFYHSDAAAAAAGRYDNFSKTLKNSLSDTLTIFPPFAGKTQGNVSVDCTDDGVLCYEARVHSTMDSFLLDLDIKCLGSLTVLGGDVNAHSEFQLLVQITLFSCGGIALGTTCSHKLCDMGTFSTFLKTWSAKATNSGQVIMPDFTVATKIPPKNEFGVRPLQFPPPKHELSTVRLVFDGLKIAALKAKSASKSTPQPTRVEAVTALIGKCAMAASKTLKNKSYYYLFRNAVNMRGKLRPSLPESAFGNAVGSYMVSSSNESETSLGSFVDKLRKGRMEYFEFLAQEDVEIVVDDIIEKIEKISRGGGDDIEIMYRFVSWCRSGLNELDFGMGKPKWVGIPPAPYKNLAFLNDADNGQGVEAQVTLTKQDMALFRLDPTLLTYASVDPAI